MPRHIIKRVQNTAEQAKLIDQLTEEITQDTTALQPLILEQQLPCGSRHIHVIWHAWQTVPSEQRAHIILQAYQRAEGDDAISDIAIASGITEREALAIGLLPYKIIPLVRKTNSVSFDDCTNAMLDEAKQTLLGELHDGALRYATLEDANRAYERLEMKLPGAAWSVVEEVSYSS